MALRYGSKNGFALRYNPYSASALRYGGKNAWTSGGATPDSYFTFTLLDDNTYSIRAKDVTNMPAEVVLPSTYNGKAVTQIEDFAFADTVNLNMCLAIMSLVIPDSYTYIGLFAFGYALNLKSVMIGNGVTYISDMAFQGCESLSHIVIPNSSVTYIGHMAFDETPFLSDESNYVDNVLYIGNVLYKAKTTISGDYIIRDGTLAISPHALQACSNLIGITIPESVISIGEYAFAQCSGLTGNVVIRYSVTSIGTYAFWDCGKLTIHCEASSKPSGWADDWNPTHCPVVWGVIIPSSEDYFTFTELDDGTYSVKAKSTSNLPDYVVIPNTYNGKAVTEIEMLAFNDTAIRRLYIPEGITSIGYASFAGCTSLVEVHLPASLTSIGDQAFNGCSSLATFTIADNSQLTSIGEYAFNYCSALTSIIIPESVTTIGEYAFRNCSNLTINCEVLLAYKPSGWASTWAGGSSVVWGYTG